MYKYKINVHPVETEDGIEWIARIPDVNNCGGSGATPAEAIEDAYENLAFELETLKEEGKEIPQPRDESKFSGKISLRMPKYLHEKIDEIAQLEEVSINQLIVATLSEKVGFYNAIEQVSSVAFSKGCENVLNKVTDIASKQVEIFFKNSEICERFSYLNKQQEQIMLKQNEQAAALVGGAANIISMYSKGLVNRR